MDDSPKWPLSRGDTGQTGSNGRNNCPGEWKIQHSWKALVYSHNASRRVVRPRLRLQDSDPRADDLDFRWEVFWGGIWKSMAFYIFVAEVWLTIESRFGLGKVSVRPPIASKRT